LKEGGINEDDEYKKCEKKKDEIKIVINLKKKNENGKNENY
jgi:hypothetical protein